MTLNVKLKRSNGILWNAMGFRLEIQRVTGTSDRFVKIGDLNPEVNIRCRFTRMETLRIGLMFIWRAITAKTPGEASQ